MNFGSITKPQFFGKNAQKNQQMDKIQYSSAQPAAEFHASRKDRWAAS